MKEKELGLGSRVGAFFLALSAPALCMVLQIVCGMIIMLPYAILKMVLAQNAGEAATINELMTVYTNAVYKVANQGVFAYHIVGVVVYAMWYYFGCGKPKLFATKDVIKPSMFVLTILSGLVILFFSNGLVGMEQYFAPGWVESYMEMVESSNFGGEVWSITAAIFIAPIGEEFLCRGVSLHFAQKALGKFWIANILQAALFGLIHLNWVQGSYAFFIGLVLGYLVKRYNSLIPAMIVHFVVNFSSSVWFGYVWNVIPQSLAVMIIITAVSGMAILFLMYVTKNKTKEESVKVSIE